MTVPSAPSSFKNAGKNPTKTELVAPDEEKRALAQKVFDKLSDIIDPEIGIDLVSLGLVYKVEIDELERAILTMTLTTPLCPLTDSIEEEIAHALWGTVSQFKVDWTFSPLWSVENISKEGVDQLRALGARI
ncbi:MAG: metal-sulfur cluster assembly factor [Aeriscardovia sp.]|nr:metal-sulfur cluster assembly factor [Aeriscardovia sp.]MBO6019331.1 metal-sulfur cluster assembly factor [Aeriscardovia sp.]MBO6049949.1 metal-sulfur cluster assembly factor [Aeriscardovia sp.]MBO6071379.1 metal-sulfur cluster assembly factor [Aeriscardovia sp.]MBO7717234.1 metal-sulfur cluster assembly factor [Aeriscardovia sp.]